MSKPKPNVIAFQPDSLTAWKYEDSWNTSLCECNGNCGELCYSLICCPCYSCRLFVKYFSIFFSLYVFFLFIQSTGHLSWRLRESCYILCLVPQPIAALRTKVRALFRIDVNNLKK
jgi:hypothetical protein